MNPNDEAFKQAVKEALAESLRENRGFIHEVLVEVFEDFALAEAVREGRSTELVERGEVFDILVGSGENRVPT